MRIEPFHHRDRLFVASTDIAQGETIRLELTPGIRIEPVSGGRLLLADGRGAWISALSLAVHLGWCRVV